MGKFEDAEGTDKWEFLTVALERFGCYAKHPNPFDIIKRMTPGVGTTVAHYRILAKLGSGGMGVVYTAHDTLLNRTVALKFVTMVMSENLQEKYNLLHEARAASQLDHPNIGVVHEIGETSDGQMYIVMTFYEGEALKARIARANAAGAQSQDAVVGLPVAEALELALQIGRGLAHAHEHAIVHRDVKPANVVVTREGVAKIIDFGLARPNDATQTATVTGVSKGTPAYMSPEQATGRHVDAPSDVWSLGVVLYEMLTGKLPFRGPHQAAQIRSILEERPQPIRELRPDVPEDLERVVGRALEKEVARRFASAAEMVQALTGCQINLAAPAATRRRPRQRVLAACAAVVVLALVAAGSILARRSGKARWAREQALPEIARLAGDNKIMAAYQLAAEAERYIPSDPEMAKVWPDISFRLNLETVPPGARVEIQEYANPAGKWTNVGLSPIENVRAPKVYLRWRVFKPGFAALQGSLPQFGAKRMVDLVPDGAIPPDMVRVAGQRANYALVSQLGGLPPMSVETFLIDKYEVTNRQYKEFVDAGGYRRKEFWKYPFLKNGKPIPWEQAIELFRDSTGRTGPATWEAGRYPDGQQDYPVAGVSWYEAAAYAEFAGKSLPTVRHWYMAADPPSSPFVAPLSNFSRQGAAPVGKYLGLGSNGTYDMAGNVKEWCWNESTDGKYFLLGGGWNDPSYQYQAADARDPFDRAPMNGFRCVKYAATPPAVMLAPIARFFRDFNKEKPVADEEFRFLRSFYDYDRTPLNPKLEFANSGQNWREEKVTIDAAYGGERIPVFIFMPQGVTPPFQVVAFGPGLQVINLPSSAELSQMDVVGFLVKSGRAVVYPIYKGTYERRISGTGKTLIERRDLKVQMTKDLRRVIDYLETRPEFDLKKLGWLGTSWGSSDGAIWSTMEERIKAFVYTDGGLYFGQDLPEADPKNFLPRNHRPALMLNGRYDFTFPLESSQRPMFRLLGAPDKDKKLMLFESGHGVFLMRWADFVRESLAWFDQYLGRVP